MYIELQAVGPRRLALPLPGLITRSCAPRCSNLPGLLGDPSPTGLFWERQTGLFRRVHPLRTKSKCLWLARAADGGGGGGGGERAGRGGVAAARRGGRGRVGVG